VRREALKLGSFNSIDKRTKKNKTGIIRDQDKSAVKALDIKVTLLSTASREPKRQAAKRFFVLLL
jgi:hypothetical protein